MTLIMGIMTKGFALLSSDRRISRTDASTGELIRQEDSDNKCFILKHQYIVGYSGIARFGGQRMEDWVTTLLKDVPLDERLEALRAGVADALHAYGEHRRFIAFMGVGFRPSSFSSRSQPHAWIISNAINPDTREIDADTLSIEVRCVDLPMPEDGVLIRHIGEAPNQAAVSRLRRAIHTGIPTSGDESLDPLPILGGLAGITVATAREHHTVGSLAQIVNLPLPENDEEEGMTIWIGEVTPGAMSHLSIGQTFDKTEPLVSFLPAFVPLPGGASIAMGRLAAGSDELGPLGDPWEEED